jgi:hypothetical protein
MAMVLSIEAAAQVPTPRQLPEASVQGLVDVSDQVLSTFNAHAQP